MLAEQNRYPNNFMETFIYLDGANTLDMRGYLEHRAEKQVWPFETVVELMRLFERLFNKVAFPQPTHQLRSIKRQNNTQEKKVSDMKGLLEDAGKEALTGQKPTFVVKVQYRQNASWQGTIKWLEGNVEKPFRSTLELIKLMDSVIGEEGENGWQ